MTRVLCPESEIVELFIGPRREVSEALASLTSKCQAGGSGAEPEMGCRFGIRPLRGDDMTAPVIGVVPGRASRDA